MQRMTHHILNRARCGHQRLPDHLPAKYALPAVIGAVAAKQVHLNLLKIKQIYQLM